MQLIKSSAEVIKITDPIDLIETCGRVCYKTKPSENTKKGDLFNRLVSSGHHSVFEHVNFIFRIECDHVMGIPYVPNIPKIFNTTNYAGFLYASSNLRFIKECGDQRFIDKILETYPELHPYLGKPSKDRYNNRLITLVTRRDFINSAPSRESIAAHLYTTMFFETDRGVANEIVRHRKCAFSQESSRYCNYSKDKFGSEIRCILPSGAEDVSEENFNAYNKCLRYIEDTYMFLLNHGCNTEFARGVLPLELATTLAVTTNHEEWKYIFGLRYFERTGKVHPNMKVLMQRARDNYYEEHWKPYS